MAAEVDAARRLRAARVLAGVETREELAERVNLAKLGAKTIGKIERGERALEEHEIPPIADALGIPVSFFTDGPGASDARKAFQQLDRIETAVAEFQAWAERAVDRIIQDRTEAIARVDHRLSVLERRTEQIADLVDVVASHSATRAREDATRIARETAERQRGTGSRTRASDRAQGDPGGRR